MPSHKLRYEGNGVCGYGESRAPQFFLTTSKAGSVDIKVDAPQADALAFFIQRVASPADAGKRLFDFPDDSRVHSSQFVAAQTISETVDNLPAGNYVILINQHEGRETDVTLTANAPAGVIASLSGAQFQPKLAQITFDSDSSYGSHLNPQVLLTVTSNTSCHFGIVLAVPHATAVRFFIQKSPTGARLLSFPEDGSRAFTSEYPASDTVDGSVVLAPGNYVILPMQQEKGVKRAASIMVESDNGPNSFTLKTIEPTAAKEKTLKFTKECAGYGDPKGPQFFITLTRKTQVVISLDAPKATAVRFFVQRPSPGSPNSSYSSNKKRLTDFPETADERVFTSKYVSATTVSSGIIEMEAGSFVVLAIHKDKGVEGPATLKLEATADPDATLDGAEFEPLRETPANSFSAELASRRRVDVDVHGSVAVGVMYETVADARAVVDAINAKCKKSATAAAAKPGEADPFEQVSQHFTDPQFTHDKKSINDPSQPSQEKVEDENCPWLRVRGIADSPQLFASGIAGEDVRQKDLGCCWLLAAIAGVATQPQLIEALIYPPVTNPAGVYAVSINTNGVWRALLVDDYFPVNEKGELRFVSSTDRSEFWPSILVKAYAKFCGSYNSLIGGNNRGVSIPQVMEMLSGGTASKLDPKKEPADWFNKLHTAMSSGNAIATTATSDNVVASPGTKVSESNLVAAHAYTILATAQVGSFQMVRMRNTWARSEWRGTWCDGHNLWKKNPEVAAACHQPLDPKPEEKDDGIFWLQASRDDGDDFIHNFSHINLLQLTRSELPHSAHVDSTFEIGSCSSDGPGDGNVLANKQFLLQFEKPGAHISVKVIFTRKCKSSLRFVLVPVPVSQRAAVTSSSSNSRIFLSPKHEGLTDDGNSIAPGVLTKFSYDEIVQRVDLATIGGSSETTYIIVPQLHPRQKADAPFRIVVSSDVPVKALKQLGNAAETKLSAAWATPASYQSDVNPKIKVTVPSAVSGALFVLLAENPDDKQGMKFVLARSTSSTKSKWPSDSDIVATSKYLSSNHIDLEARDLAPGEYVMWATLQRPTSRRFEVTCLSSVKIGLEKL